MRKINSPSEKKEFAAVSWLKGSKHSFYEDSFRMLTRDIPIVHNENRGELFAVYDGIGSAPEGRHAAQVMADCLVRFYREPDVFSASIEGLLNLLMKTNLMIAGWGFMTGTDKPLGGCAGSVVWINSNELVLFHAGDTSALLIRDGKIKPLSEVHQFADGAIYRYFGLGQNLSIQVLPMVIEELDRIILCSDGVTKVMDNHEIGLLLEGGLDPETAVKTLVQRAKAKGSTDDITAMLIQIEEIWDDDDI